MEKANLQMKAELQTVVPGEAPFYILATDAPSRPRRCLKSNDTFAVFDSHGDIGASAGGQDGLFDSDTRYLSHLEMLIAGSGPLLLHSAVSDDNLSFYGDLTNPDIFTDGAISLPRDTLHVSRTMFLCDGALRERVSIKNHGAHPTTFTLTQAFASDFADIFEVRGIKRKKRGKAWSEIVAPDLTRLTYRGLDDVVRETELRFEPKPSKLALSSASYDIQLAPGERFTIFISVTSRSSPAGVMSSYFRGLVTLKRQRRAETSSGIGSIETSNATVNEILCRSMADLHMLRTATPDGPYPYAGIPWYSTAFGRDGIITAMEMLWIDPSLSAGVLRYLAHHQALVNDRSSDAAPGKILHEMRAGEMALLGEVPFGCYYGTVDATPLFIMLAGQYAERTGDHELVRELWPAIERALSWLDGPGDIDGDGLIEFARETPAGLANQGWKDSHDSIFHADGRLAEGPIALVEVQGYAYAARLSAALCARALGLHERAEELVAQAQRIAVLFEEKFWCEELGFYAHALDGRKAQCKVYTSNPGHALWTGIARHDRAVKVARKLLSGEFFSGWGIRTVAEGEARYNPMSYHNGSIWPHDNAIIAAGLERTGFKHGAATIFEALMRATSYLDQRRIPELYCGFRRRSARGPTLYPAACSPQAWSAAAPFSLIRSMLGLEFCPQHGEVRLRNPILPGMVGSITLRGIRLGNATADFAVHPSVGRVALEVLRTQGDVRISVIVDDSAN